MAVLNLTDPNHPSFSYQSGGTTVNGDVQCGCASTDAACLTRCQNQARRLLDASLAVLPED